MEDILYKTALTLAFRKRFILPDVNTILLKLYNDYVINDDINNLSKKGFFQFTGNFITTKVVHGDNIKIVFDLIAILLLFKKHKLSILDNIYYLKTFVLFKKEDTVFLPIYDEEKIVELWNKFNELPNKERNSNYLKEIAISLQNDTRQEVISLTKGKKDITEIDRFYNKLQENLYILLLNLIQKPNEPQHKIVIEIEDD